MSGHHDSCRHHHAPPAQTAADARLLTVAFAVIAVFMVVEVVGGLVAGSLALLADAAHMFTDAFALGFAALAQLIAARPADRRRHFGYQRTQVIAAFVNAIILLVLLFGILIEAAQRFFTGPPPVDWALMLTVALVGLVVNAAVFLMLHRAERRRAGGAENVNVRGAMLHVAADMLGSLAAVASAIVIAASGWMTIDPLLSLLVAALIGRSAIALLGETLHTLMEGAPAGIDPAALKKGVYEAAPGVVDVYRLQISELAPGEPRLTMHVRIASAADSPDVLRRIKAYLRDVHGVERSTVQLEIGDDGCPDCPDGDEGAFRADAYLTAEPFGAPAGAARRADGPLTPVPATAPER